MASRDAAAHRPGATTLSRISTSVVKVCLGVAWCSSPAMTGLLQWFGVVDDEDEDDWNQAYRALTIGRGKTCEFVCFVDWLSKSVAVRQDRSQDRPHHTSSPRSLTHRTRARKKGGLGNLGIADFITFIFMTCSWS